MHITRLVDGTAGLSSEGSPEARVILLTGNLLATLILSSYQTNLELAGKKFYCRFGQFSNYSGELTWLKGSRVVANWQRVAGG